MRMLDLIHKKKHGDSLSQAEIAYWIDAYMSGEIPDYQVSALLMAIYFNGMNDQELAILTRVLAQSGDTLDLSFISGITVDKHSSGGVGDKTTLIVAPLAAACDLKVAKLSGRGLGHTGGTVDKLEAIPGFKVDLSEEMFFRCITENGLAVAGQTAHLAPADKKLYALRDVTGTVDSLPLIAASIMSKKLASGSQCIVLDVKCGSGAFMKTLDEAIDLAKKMVAIALANGRQCSALVTNMDRPLGFAIGNSLEVMEAIKTLKGEGPADLKALSLALTAELLHLAGRGSLEVCLEEATDALRRGKALACFRKMIEAQSGDEAVMDDFKRFKQPVFSYSVLAQSSGYLSQIDAEGLGHASVCLGAGREILNSLIDYSAGILMCKQLGDRVEEGEALAIFYADDEALFDSAEAKLLRSLTITSAPPVAKPIVLARVSENGVVRYGLDTPCFLDLI